MLSPHDYVYFMVILIIIHYTSLFDFKQAPVGHWQEDTENMI